MKIFAVIAIAGLLCISPTAGLQLRGRSLSTNDVNDPFSHNYQFNADNTTNAYNAADGFNALPSRTFTQDGPTLTINSITTDAPQIGSGEHSVACNGNIDNGGTCIFETGTKVNTAIARVKCSAASNLEKLIESDSAHFIGACQGIYHHVDGNGLGGENSTPETIDTDDAAATCRDALCLGLESTADITNTYEALDAAEDCAVVGDQEFLKKLDCAYVRSTANTAYDGNTNNPHFTDLGLNSAGEVEALVDGDDCTGIDGEDVMEEALYNLHFTLQEKVLLKLWEHARAQCLQLVEERTKDREEYEASVEEVRQAQSDLGREIVLYQRFQSEVASVQKERYEDIASIESDLQLYIDSLIGQKNEAIANLNTELKGYSIHAQAAARKYKDDLSYFFESMATKKANLADKKSKHDTVNLQIKNHREDLEELDVTLSGLLDTIVNAINTADEEMDKVKDEAVNVLADSVAERDYTRSSDANATYPNANHEVIGSNLGYGANGQKSDVSLTTDGVREVCADPNYAHDSNYNQSVASATCGDNPEPDYIAENWNGAERDNLEIIVKTSKDNVQSTFSYDLRGDGIAPGAGSCGLCAA